MCGRFVRKSTRRQIAESFEVDPEEIPEFAASYNVAPQSFQPVVRLNHRTGEREVALLRWGLIPFWAKDPGKDTRIGYSTINARAETVATAPVFREAMKRRRCLVPADAFYEWQKLDARHKQPFAIALKSRGLYAFAGLWDRWRDPHAQQSLETFCIITVPSNKLLEPMHDRMPAILDPEDYDRWLTPAPAGADDPAHLPASLLRTYPAEKMLAWKVDRRVGNVKNDDAGLVEEAPVEASPAGLPFA